MWDVIKNAVTGLKDALGIEVGSADATAIGEGVATAAQGATETAATAVEDLSATAGETVSGIADAAPRPPTELP